MESNSAEIIKELAINSIKPVEIELADGTKEQFLIVPSSSELKDFDQYNSCPRRVESAKPVHSVESFIDYVNDFKIPNTCIFGNPGSETPFNATIDYHQRDEDNDFVEPLWCSHKLSLRVEKTPEWKTWSDNEANRFSQRSFLHFIEDNIEDIQQPEHAKLIEQIKNVKIGGASKTDSSVDHSKESIDTSNSVSVSSGVPENLELAIKPWRFSKPYKVQARIFLHIEERKIEFSYHLINADRVLEHLFDDYRTQIEEGTDIKVYV